MSMWFDYVKNTFLRFLGDFDVTDNLDGGYRASSANENKISSQINVNTVVYTCL